MATTAVSGALDLRDRVSRPLGGLATIAILAALAMAIAVEVPDPTPAVVVAVLVVLGASLWMLFSERYEWSLVVLMLYVGLADGYLKLSTGSSSVTLVRDLLLYAIVAGALARAAVRDEELALPPLSGWVIAWLAVIAVQLANPHNGTMLHSLAAVRPHAEWVPLFFLGYLVVRSRARIRAFLVLLLVVAAANGVVGLVQQNLTPDQLAGWGPGYAAALKGESSVSARTFADEEGTERNRPFALGGDIGFGGAVGFLAVPAALALLGLARTPLSRFGFALLSVGVVLAVLTSAGRIYIVGAVVAILAFAALTVTSRGGMRIVLGTAVGLALAYFAIGTLMSDSESGSYDRFQSIDSPGKALSTAYDYRKATLAQIPNYVTEIPFGAGIGSKGPAGSFGGGGGTGGSRLNGESEPTYLLIELGVAGLVVMLGFNLRLLFLSATRIRRLADRETRALLTAMAAPLFALLVTWLGGVATATTPGAPYLWFAGGVLSYWLLGAGRRARWPSA
jgi:hypothetical protein